MTRRGVSAVFGAALAAMTACTIIEPPLQCRSDDDCGRFGARCDIAQSVCVPERAPSSTMAASLGDATPTPSGATSDAPAVASDASPTSIDSPLADAGVAPTVDAGTNASTATITCGDVTCPVGPDSVCCIRDGTASCSTAADCPRARVACDETSDCQQLGFGDGIVCCAFNDGVGPRLLRAECVPSAECDADGPQDQLCKVDGPADQCMVANDGRTACEPFTYSNATGYAFCVAP